MNTLNISTTKNLAALARRLFKLERCGKYANALDQLADIWPDCAGLPNIDGFEPYDAAEILLRCGSLIGFHGHNAQLDEAQERSRDLLMAARSKFHDLADLEKTVECENYLALTYWRTGELNEAQTWIDESISHSFPLSNPNKLFSQIIQCLINIPAKKYTENLANLKSSESVFLDCDDDCLKGDYYTHCGLALKNLERRSEALDHYELSKYYFQRSRHKIYLGAVENNLAHLYKETGKFGKAHQSLDNATRIFRQLKDKTREGFSFDTKALIYFAEAKYAEALKTVEKGLSILRKSENSAYLIETLLTKAKILLFLDNFSDAVLTLIDAVNIANVQTGEQSAKRLIKEFESALQSKNQPVVETTAIDTTDLKLVLPASLAKYSEYKGVWINTELLQNVGLVSGSLAIIVPDTIKRGDLVAISELANGEVSCGFYDSDFGIVCLERGDDDPLLFDQDEVKVLGKIVGVCSTGIDADGKMTVEALKL